MHSMSKNRSVSSTLTLRTVCHLHLIAGFVTCKSQQIYFEDDILEGDVFTILFRTYMFRFSDPCCYKIRLM